MKINSFLKLIVLVPVVLGLLIGATQFWFIHQKEDLETLRTSANRISTGVFQLALLTQEFTTLSSPDHPALHLEDQTMTDLPRILLVEDSPRDAELTLMAFKQYNFVNEILHLHDGVEALDFLFRRGTFADRPDGVPAAMLLDIKMPRVDGLEVLRQVKADPELKLMPVVIMTSSREEQDLMESYSLGVNAYVVKPVDFKSFVEAVKQIGAFWAVINEPPPSKDKRLHNP